MKFLIVGYNLDRCETCIDYLAGHDIETAMATWHSKRLETFNLVAVWTTTELQDTLDTIRRTPEHRLIEDFKQTALPYDEKGHRAVGTRRGWWWPRKNKYNPAAGDALGAVDRTVLAEEKEANNDE